jgi:hypothetical protein
MTEITIGSDVYSIGQLDPFQQLDVATKLLPALTGISAALKAAGVTPGAVASLQVAEDKAPDVDPAGGDQEAASPAVDALFGAVTTAIGKLSREDTHMIVQTCMGVVKRRQGTGSNTAWTPVWNPRAMRFQFDDIKLPQMLQLTFEVIKISLSDFFSGPSSILSRR